MNESRLYRARDAYIGGVCAGIADHFDLDHIVVRILAVLLAGLTLGVAGVIYIVLWVRLPRQPEPAAPLDVTLESAESSAYGAIDHKTLLDEMRMCEPGGYGIPLLARVAVASGLMLLFVLIAVNLSPLVPGTEWWQYWPLAFLITGLCLIVIPVRSRHETIWHAVGVILTSMSASVLPMSLGVISWATIPHALQMFWPIVVLGVALFCVGVVRGIDALVLAGAFCAVAFCLVACTFCVLPGELESLMLHIPGGRSLRIAFYR